MQPFDGDLVHLRQNRMAAIAGEPIGLHADNEMRAQFLGQAIKLEDIAFTVPDMDAA